MWAKMRIMQIFISLSSCFLPLALLASSGTVTLAEAAHNDNQTVPTSGLFWNDLSVQTADGTFLLRNWNGFIPNGRVCGILGPSGAGKSTTLAALGGTISSSSGLQVNGEVLYYSVEKHTTENLQVQGGRVAWLQQKDIFFNMLSVQETLELAAFLELPQFTEPQRVRRVRNTMDSLGLTQLQDRSIGDSSMHKGLSGGERRRLSLALELIASPKLFIGDEPTSGLVSGGRRTILMACVKTFFSCAHKGIPIFQGFDIERKGRQTYQNASATKADSVHTIAASTEFINLANVGFSDPHGSWRTGLLYG
jgi:ABC-type lipoprotein export system ATPase subunit